LNAFSPGYEEAAGPWMSANWSLHNVPFPSNQTQQLTIKLRAALYVAGIVTDESGRPFAGARIEAALYDGTSQFYLSFDETDVNGRFEMFDFPLNPSDVTGRTHARGQLAFESSTMLKHVGRPPTPCQRRRRSYSF
jgi:hypothetical protein